MSSSASSRSKVPDLGRFNLNIFGGYIVIIAAIEEHIVIHFLIKTFPCDMKSTSSSALPVVGEIGSMVMVSVMANPLDFTITELSSPLTTTTSQSPASLEVLILNLHTILSGGPGRDRTGRYHYHLSISSLTEPVVEVKFIPVIVTVWTSPSAWADFWADRRDLNWGY